MLFVCLFVCGKLRAHARFAVVRFKLCDAMVIVARVRSLKCRHAAPLAFMIFVHDEARVKARCRRRVSLSLSLSLFLFLSLDIMLLLLRVACALSVYKGHAEQALA